MSVDKPQTPADLHAYLAGVDVEDAEQFAALVQQCQRLGVALDQVLQRCIQVCATTRSAPQLADAGPSPISHEAKSVDLIAAANEGRLVEALIALQESVMNTATALDFQNAYAASTARQLEI